MKRLLAALLVLTYISVGYAQQKAITEEGDEVILFHDGTWQYTDTEPKEVKEIKTNSKKFKRSDKASFLLKSKVTDLGFWVDTKKWKFTKGGSDSDSEYELEMKGSDLYGMIITEAVEIPLATLRELAIENGRAVAPDLRIIKEEYRTVNGLKVLMLQMNGTMQGIKFSYFGYYYSNEAGTIQYITYTAQNLLKKYRDDAEELLNGLVEVKG